MAGTRALFASIGASVVLVAAAALSLLAVSVVFAFGWASVSVPESVRTQPLVFAGTTPSPSSSAAAVSRIATGRPIVVAPARRPGRRGAAPPGAAGSSAVRARERPAASRAMVAPRATPALSPPEARSTGGPKRSPAPVAKPSAGEGVRKVGDDLSATVKDTGTAIAEVTQPLAPPVSAVVQKVFNVVAELLSRTTGVLAGTVDNLLKPENKEMLTKILTAHVIPAKATSEAAMGMIKDDGGKHNVTTVSGDALTHST